MLRKQLAKGCNGCTSAIMAYAHVADITYAFTLTCLLCAVQMPTTAHRAMAPK